MLSIITFDILIIYHRLIKYSQHLWIRQIHKMLDSQNYVWKNKSRGNSACDH